jgi:hypothetical protein
VRRLTNTQEPSLSLRIVRPRSLPSLGVVLKTKKRRGNYEYNTSSCKS